MNRGMAEAQGLMKNASKVDDLLIQVEEALRAVPSIGGTLSQVPLMISMVKSYITGDYTEVSPKVIATLIAGFIYAVKKKDLIADNIPVIGMADDLGVLGLALKFCEPELTAYKAFRDGKKEQPPIYSFTVTTGTGEELNLADYKGKVILIVNTATGCGLHHSMRRSNSCTRTTMTRGSRFWISHATSSAARRRGQMKRSMSSVPCISTQHSRR